MRVEISYNDLTTDQKTIHALLVDKMGFECVIYRVYEGLISLYYPKEEAPKDVYYYGGMQSHGSFYTYVNDVNGAYHIYASTLILFNKVKRTTGEGFITFNGVVFDFS